MAAFAAFLVLTLLFATAASAQEATTPLNPSLVNFDDFPTTWDGSPEKFTEKATLQTFSFFQLFWFAGNNLCDSATKSRIESQLSQQEGKTVTCSATAGLGAFVGTCDWWCDVQAAGGINCQGDNNKCSIQDKCVNNQCVPVTCGTNQYVSDHQCHDTLPVQTCIDSDGGDLPLSKGSTYLNGRFVAADQCSSDGRQLQEKYCSGTIPNSRVYSCTYGCSGGACLEQKITSCIGKPDATIITSYCDGDTAKKSVCFGQVEQTAQQSCSNIGKTCAAGECVTPSGGTGGTPNCNDGIKNQDETGIDCGGTCSSCGAGGGTGGGSQVCCQRNLVTAEGLYYFAANAESCNQRGVGGVLGKDPVVAIEKCSGGTGGGGTTCAADEVKQADGTCKKASTGDFTVVKTQPSIPSGRLGTASGGTLLNSLCTADSDCGSGACEDIETLEAELDDKARSILDRINEAKEAKSNDIKSALAHGTLGKILKFGVGLIINTDAFKEEPKSICVMRREGGFDFKNFFEDNQAAVVGGAIILALLIFLPRLMGK